MNRFLRSGAVGCAMGSAALLAAALGGADRSPLNFYQQRNLVSDGFIHAEHTDPHLVNAWGLQFNPAANGFWWVNDAETGVSTLYDADGNINQLVVSVPAGSGESGEAGHPTGIVFNAGGGFVVSDGANSAPARFIFATEEGTVAAWAPTVPPPPPSTHAFTMYPAPGAPATGASYKGLAIANNGQGDFLYATDFDNAKIDVLDSSFHLVTLAGAFQDPNLPDRFAPFGIRAINDVLFVTYAMQDADAEDAVAGRGLGIVDAFDLSGNLLRRMITGGKLNAPWGLALAPRNFGKFGGMLLVGNFGDGRINAYDPISGSFRGTLTSPRGGPIEIDGLWGLSFGNDNLAGPSIVLFFTAGPGDEEHGLFGSLTAVGPGRARGGHGR